MSQLQQIGDMAQNLAENIAHVVGIEVNVADEELLRIAGTGCFAKGIGDKLNDRIILDQVLRLGQGVINYNLQTHDSCQACSAKDNCLARAIVCQPIRIGEKIIGIISLQASNLKQKQTLVKHQQSLYNFINGIGELLANQVTIRHVSTELNEAKHKMQTVMNIVNEGIISTDYNGRVTDINILAQKIIGVKAQEAVNRKINHLFPGISLNAGIQPSAEIVSRELNCRINLKSWSDSVNIKGFIISVREMGEARHNVFQSPKSQADYTFDMILGKSEAISAVKKAAVTVARYNSTVFIKGESGTGKELFAKAIHFASERKNKPFIAINCAAIPETLLESELFGYVEGAFTGARRGGKPGKFEMANGGTIFLDEIGDMSLSLQAKLLRVLQEKRIERVGETESVPVDMRIISATHKDIETMVENGEFRQDLYYRINVFPLLIPSLRERREDLPELISFYLEKYQRLLGNVITGIDDKAYQLLVTYEWPGNVRELENVMEYLVGIEMEGTISEKSVLARIRSKGYVQADETDIIPLATIERQKIIAALERFGTTNSGKKKAAMALGVSEATIYRKLKEYNVK
jgi:sigma-54 dependent transcriptional regulator, acetoin dehydrogenase operon transcriptional activator AcoR